MSEDHQLLAAKLRKAATQLPHIPRTLALVWEAAGAWTSAWAALLVVQGLLPVAIVYLTRTLVDRVAVVFRNHGDAQSLSGAAIPAALMAAVIRVGRAIDAALTPEGMNLITSAGKAAEQSVFHLHLHVVPRWHRDGFGRIWPHDDRYEDSEMGDVAGRIRAACSDLE